ncbi:MAG: fructosamine kinase family protein [Lachnospiraceae bacterium]|nr:fructosamine kinase family protein [Lachnospiraceae bacterium]
MTVYSSLAEAIRDIFGEGVAIIDRRSISGGDINAAWALILSDGSKVFMKSNRLENQDFFRAEAEGLEAISSCNTIKTPGILGRGTDGAISFLLLEYISGGRRRTDFFTEFGRELAALHSACASRFTGGRRYGFRNDNYIGAGYQKNTGEDSWIAFFREYRLELQFKKAEAYFDQGDVRRINRLLERVDELLIEPESPSLIHGDLWGGNYMEGNDGSAWLIDPAAYVGCAEADIAMTELFGGFHMDFYSGYYEVRPKLSGYEERRDIYNLYHLLNHLNLFGGGYLSSVRAAVRKYC